MFSMIWYFSLEVHLSPQNGHSFWLLSTNPRLVKPGNSCRLRSLNETASSPSRGLSISNHACLLLGSINTDSSAHGHSCQGYGIAIRVLNTEWAIVWSEPGDMMVFQKRGIMCSHSLECGMTSGSKARVNLSPTPVRGVTFLHQRTILQTMTATKHGSSEKCQNITTQSLPPKRSK